MLVLSRRAGESIQTDDLTITILEVAGNTVRLGFAGSGAVWRTEVLDRPPAPMPLRAEDLEEATA